MGTEGYPWLWINGSVQSENIGFYRWAGKSWEGFQQEHDGSDFHFNSIALKAVLRNAKGAGVEVLLGAGQLGSYYHISAWDADDSR